MWSGEDSDAKECLTKQVVVSLEEDAEDDLSSIENIVKFLNRNSRFGKTVREIEEIGETLSSTIYKIVGTEDEIAIKVPKKLPFDPETLPFMDLIYQTQLMQFLKDRRADGKRQFFPSVLEEIFVVNKNTHTVLNYVTFVEYSSVSVINMLDGPTAGGYKNDDIDEEGYRS